MLGDSINLVAKVLSLTATIYNNLYRSGRTPEPTLNSVCTSNYVRMLGWDNQEFFKMMLLNLLLHPEHEGGNIPTRTAHTAHMYTMPTMPKMPTSHLQLSPTSASHSQQAEGLQAHFTGWLASLPQLNT